MALSEHIAEETEAEERWREFHPAKGDGRATHLIVDDTNNCYAACISMLTGIPFDALKVDWERESLQRHQELHSRMNALLKERGWRIVRLFRQIPAGFAIGSGPSPRGNWDHAVIVKDGTLFHDPHPSGLFVTGLTEFEILIPILGEVRGV